jgi:hypothetical protein
LYNFFISKNKSFFFFKYKYFYLKKKTKKRRKKRYYIFLFKYINQYFKNLKESYIPTKFETLDDLFLKRKRQNFFNLKESHEIITKKAEVLYYYMKRLKFYHENFEKVNIILKRKYNIIIKENEFNNSNVKNINNSLNKVTNFELVTLFNEEKKNNNKKENLEEDLYILNTYNENFFEGYLDEFIDFQKLRQEDFIITDEDLYYDEDNLFDDIIVKKEQMEKQNLEKEIDPYE